MALFMLDVILGFVASRLLPLLQKYSSPQEYLTLLLLVPCLTISLLCLVQRPFLYVDPNKEHSLHLLTPTSDITVPEAEAVNNFDCYGQKADWLETPDDVLLCIAAKLVDVQDIIRFGAVCASWRPIYIEKRTSSRLASTSQQIPMLLLSTDINDNHNTRSLYSVTEKRVLNFQVCMSQDLYCPGSSHGWLVTVSKDYKMCLVNPLMAVNNEIVLPPLTSFPIDSRRGEARFYTSGIFCFLQKVVLSANPASNPNFIALAIYGTFSRLAYFKPGRKAWTSLSFQYAGIMDIIYYENRFYAVSGNGPVYILDFTGMYLKISELVVPPVESMALKRYLVESSGDLLQVLRHTDWDDMDNYFNDGFDVFKLDRIGNNWNKVTELSGHALFLGLNTSLSVLASDFPGCKPNSIYYTDDYVEGWNWKPTERAEHWLHDIGMFNIEDRTTEQHYPTESKRMFVAPIWIEPTL